MGTDLKRGQRAGLPVQLKDLAKFVLIGREKLVAVRAEIRAMDTLGIASGVRTQKQGEAQMLAEALLDAEVRIGELTREIPKDNPNKRIGTAAESSGKMETVKRLGLNQTQVERFEALAEYPELVEKVKAEARQNDDLPTRADVLQRIKVARSNEEGSKRRATPLPPGKYRVIYADPPWEYDNGGFSMSAANQYPTLSTEEIGSYTDGAGKTINECIADDAVLFLWVTNPILPDGLRVMEAWGFEYKTCFVWVKTHHTAGFYVYGQHELLLLGTRGTHMLPTGEKPKSVIYGENTKHSKKPECVYELIEKMYPGEKYFEGFRRNAREGWVGFGNESLED